MYQPASGQYPRIGDRVEYGVEYDLGRPLWHGEGIFVRSEPFGESGTMWTVRRDDGVLIGLLPHLGDTMAKA